MIKTAHTPKGPDNRRHRAEEMKVISVDRVEWHDTPCTDFQYVPVRGIYKNTERIRVWRDVVLQDPDGTTLEIDTLTVPMDVIYGSFDMDDT